MGTSKAQRAATAARRAKAIELKIAGARWQQIADQLGYSSRGAACKDVTRAMEEALAEQAAGVDVYRELELDRLDRLQVAFWKRAMGGEIKAGELVLKTIDRRIRARGLDAPTRVSVEAENLGREIADLLATLGGADGSGTDE